MKYAIPMPLCPSVATERIWITCLLFSVTLKERGRQHGLCPLQPQPFLEALVCYCNLPFSLLKVSLYYIINTNKMLVEKNHIKFMLFVLDVYKIQSVQEAGIFLQGAVLFSLFNFTLTDIFTLGKIKTYIFLSLYQDKFSEHQAFQDMQPTPPERPTDRSVCFGIQFSPSLISSCLCQQCEASWTKQIRALKWTGHHHLLMSSVLSWFRSRIVVKRKY